MLTLRWSGGAAGQGHGGSSARAADGLEQRSFDGGGARTAERWHGGAGVGGRRGAGAGGADDGERPAGEVARVAEEACVEAGGGAAGGAGGAERAPEERTTASGAANFGSLTASISVAPRWSLVENGWNGEEEEAGSFKAERPFGPVGGTNRDQRVFRPSWCHQPGRKTYPFVPVGGTNRT